MRIEMPTFNGHHADHIVFREKTWDFYQTVLREYDEQPTRVNFDGSTLEIMTLSIEHEAYKEFIGRLIGEVAIEFDLPMMAGGSTTLKLPTQQKGLEADQCFWIQHEATVRGLTRLDLSIHPAPDLVVEIDVTHAVVDRESIYASIGVPEMWHFDKQTQLTAWELTDGVWSRIERSKALPMIRISDFNPFIQKLTSVGSTAVLKEFRAWLRALPR